MAGTVVASTINNDTGLFATNNAYLGIAKAWVNFDGTASPPTIRASFNVSSITLVTTGQYTVNFTTAMTDKNYVTAGMASNDSSSVGWLAENGTYTTARSTTSTSILINTSAAFVNRTSVSFMVIGN